MIDQDVIIVVVALVCFSNDYRIILVD
jgi:hypothetical protein